RARRVVPGPAPSLLLSKLAPPAAPRTPPLDLLDPLLPVYEDLLALLAARDVAWVQIDEPCLVLDLDDRARQAYRRALGRLAACPKRPRVLLATYFGALEENLPLATGSGCDGLHADLVRAPEQLDPLLEGMEPHMVLSLGVVDGRNVWRTDLDAAHALVRRAVARLGAERVLVAPSCSLLHVPTDLDTERALDPELKSWLAFASQKLGEVHTLTHA